MLMSVVGASVPAEIVKASGGGPDLARLVEQRDYIALQAALRGNAEFSRNDRLFYSGVLANRRNRLEDALKLLEPVLANPAKGLTATQTRVGLGALADCYVKLFRYKDAADTFGRMLRVLKSSLSVSEKRELEDSRQLMTLLRTAPPQSASPGRTFEIPIHRNRIGLMEIPVTVVGQKRSWILDTGANFSLIARSVAAELRLKVSAGHASVTRTGGVSVPAQTSIVPELAVGGSVFRNVVALVVEDKDFYIPQLGFQIREVLGYPVLSALQRLTIDRRERLAVRSDKEQQLGTTTLWLEGLTPLVALQVDNREELFVLDSGARHSYLSVRYLQKHRDAFAGKVPGRINFGGAGRRRSVPAYSVKEMPFKLGEAETDLQQVPVAGARTGTGTDSFYGIIAQDFLDRFQSYTLDFANMTVSVGPKTSEPKK